MEPRDFDDLRSTGLLWYINRTALHPHGLALAIHYDDDNVVGWSIMKSDDGLWSYLEEDDQAGRGRFSAFLEELD